MEVTAIGYALTFPLCGPLPLALPGPLSGAGMPAGQARKDYRCPLPLQRAEGALRERVGVRANPFAAFSTGPYREDG